MEWTRTEMIALALPNCTHCDGLGVRELKYNRLRPCRCVLRGVFRACYNRFCYLLTKEKHRSKVTLEFTSRGGRRATWGRKDEEFIADFSLLARRHLNDEEWRIFRYHFLLGADWKLCTWKLKMTRGDFYHAVYRIETRLGNVFQNVKPYALFPLDEYFNSVDPHDVRVRKMRPRLARPESLHLKLNVPVRDAA